MERLDDNDILFIINPNSGEGRSLKVVNKLNSLKPDISYIITNDLEELEDAFRKNLDKYTAYILVGGDGTVRASLKYLYKKNDKILGVLPAGSGNGFSKELGFKRSINSIIEHTKSGDYNEVDLMTINDDLFINAAGLGIDSNTAHLFHKSKGRGLSNYIISFVKSVCTFKPFQATLIIDKHKIEGKYLMITVANTRQFGNNAIISPDSSPFDGFFELVLVKPFPMYLLPLFLLRMFSGKLKPGRFIEYIKVKDGVSIKSEFKKYHVDGDPKTFSDKLIVKLLSEKIKVVKMKDIVNTSP